VLRRRLLLKEDCQAELIREIFDNHNHRLGLSLIIALDRCEIQVRA
jgi:hypothetical protein